jgi:hypothetical protein
MFTATLRRIGDDFVIEVPPEEVDRLGLAEGDAVVLDVRPADPGTGLAGDLRDAFEASWDRNAEGYRYLAGR